MQNDYGGCEPHNQYGRSKRPKSVRITGKGVSDPMYERRERGRLQPQRDYHHPSRYTDLTNYGHCSRYPQWTATLPPLPGWFLASRKHKKNISAEVEASSQ